jgi:hypothetical protein
VLIKKKAFKIKTVWVVKRAPHNEYHPASNPASRNDTADVATGQASPSLHIRPSHSSEADASAGVSTPAPTNYQGAHPKRLVFSAATNDVTTAGELMFHRCATFAVATNDSTTAGELLSPRCATVAAAAATNDAAASGEVLSPRCAPVAAAADTNDVTNTDQRTTLQKSAIMVNYLRQELRERNTKEYGWIAAKRTL